MNQLSKRYQALKQNVQDGINASLDALFVIWNEQLWQEEYASFEEFIKFEVDISKSEVYRRLQALDVAKRLGSSRKRDAKIAQNTLKTTQLLEISKLPTTQQEEAAAKVIKGNADSEKPPTTKDVRIVVDEMLNTNGHHEPEDNTPTGVASDMHTAHVVEQDNNGWEPEEGTHPQIKEAKRHLSLADQFHGKLLREIDEYATAVGVYGSKEYETTQDSLNVVLGVLQKWRKAI